MTSPTFAQSRCRFAIAYDDITPPIGIYHRMWGAAKHDRASGIHRPLKATVLVFAPRLEPHSTIRPQIILALDHCILGAKELAVICNAITTKAGVDINQLAVVCSHTHAAGLLSLDRANLPGGDQIPSYLESLAETASRLVQKAQSEIQPATLTYGTGRCNLAANRDYWDEGSQQFVCGYNPFEPADETLLVIRAESNEGRTLATIVNYACHPTTLAWDNTLISPDFPGATRKVIEAATNAPCAFLQGASGELGPREGFVGDPLTADQNGKQLGYAALSTLMSLPRADSMYEYQGPVVSGATIGTWAYRDLNPSEQRQLATWSHWRGAIGLNYRPDLIPIEQIVLQLEQLEREESNARKNGDHQAAAEYRALVERRRRELGRRKALPTGDKYPYQVAVWRMGEAVWLAVQGEPYSLLQMELRRRFPSVAIVVCSLGFSWGVSYLPPKDKYGLGLYQESIAVVARGSLEFLIDELSEQLCKLLAPTIDS